jgi:SAM-dependent methyltransferase
VRNVAPWADCVRRQEIESRRLVTDQAVIDVIRQHAPRSVVDIGCGEGWLARALAALGIEVTGLDVVPELIAKAQTADGGRFRIASFANIATGGIDLGAQLAVCNEAAGPLRPASELRMHEGLREVYNWPLPRPNLAVFLPDWRPDRRRRGTKVDRPGA